MAISGPLLPPEFSDQVVLSCEAVVGGERVYVQTRCVKAVYDNPEGRKMVQGMVRDALMRKILEKWTPVIKVQR